MRLMPFRHANTPTPTKKTSVQSLYIFVLFPSWFPTRTCVFWPDLHSSILPSSIFFPTTPTYCSLCFPLLPTAPYCCPALSLFEFLRASGCGSPTNGGSGDGQLSGGGRTRRGGEYKWWWWCRRVIWPLSFSPLTRLAFLTLILAGLWNLRRTFRAVLGWRWGGMAFERRTAHQGKNLSSSLLRRL